MAISNAWERYADAWFRPLGSVRNKLNCRCSIGNASVWIFKLVGHYSLVGLVKPDALLLRLWLEGGHRRINPNRDERDSLRHRAEAPRLDTTPDVQ